MFVSTKDRSAGISPLEGLRREGDGTNGYVIRVSPSLKIRSPVKDLRAPLYSNIVADNIDRIMGQEEEGYLGVSGEEGRYL